MQYNAFLIDELKTQRQLLIRDLVELKPYADYPEVARHIRFIVQERKELFFEIGALQAEGN